jgi:hypothetical protein
VLRSAVATLLAVAVLVLAAAPHVHEAAAQDRQECVACATARAAASPAAVPDVAPQRVVEELVALAPGLAPVTGAPLGAIPGQSPPVA